MCISLWSGVRNFSLLAMLVCFAVNAAERLPLAEPFSYQRLQAYQGESFRRIFLLNGSSFYGSTL